MNKESKPLPKSRPRRQRFIEAAKEVEADETGEAFDKAFGKIVPPVKPHQKKAEEKIS